MKIVNREEFLETPDNTLFMTIWKDWLFKDALELKLKTTEWWNNYDVIWVYNHFNYDKSYWDNLNDFKKWLDVKLQFSHCKDRCTQDKYVIFTKEEVKGMISILEKAIK